MRVQNSIFDVTGVEISNRVVSPRQPADRIDIPKKPFQSNEELRDHLGSVQGPLKQKIQVFLGCSANNLEAARKGLRDQLDAERYPSEAIDQIMTALETQRTASQQNRAMGYALRAIGRPSAKTR
jgi:hypothetical protein